MKIKEALLEPMVTHLLQLCKQVLELDELPPISLINEPAIKSGEKMSFGEFDGKSIKVVSKDRHPIDVMRTLAHELTHWKQRLEGQDLDGSDGSPTENQANAVAGIIMRRFGEKYPEYFMDSLP
jgi:hypothetical protein